MTILEQAIKIDGLRIYAYHGVDPQEAIVGAWYTVSITMNADATAAVLFDDLDGTVNYAKVADIVKQQMLVRSALLEHVAGRIANALLESIPAIKSITVKVCKEHPPVCSPCEASSFILTVKR